MAKVNLTPKQILEFVIIGINNGNYKAVKDLVQDVLDIMNKEEKEKENNEK